MARSRFGRLVRHIRKNVSVFYDDFSVSFENLRFVAPSLPEYIMNSNYVD